MAGDANCSTRMKTYSIVDAAILGKTNLAFAFLNNSARASTRAHCRTANARDYIRRALEEESVWKYELANARYGSKMRLTPVSDIE